MTGTLINSAALILGTLGGVVLGHKVPERIKNRLPLLFGLASIGLGLAMINKMHSLPPTILTFILASILGEIVDLERNIQSLASKARGVIDKISSAPSNISDHEYLEQFVALLILFCASGTGIFGAMNEGISGDASMLIIKSCLDLFTAGIFAINLGISVMFLAIPQAIIQVSLFFAGQLVVPLTTPEMIADFSAVGGLILLATGLRICGIMSYPTANMLPALIFIMPVSYLWGS